MGPWIVPVSGFILFALNEIANPRRAFLGKVLWKGDRRGVGLTFDDGPHPLHTARVLDILEQFQAKATFFVIGRHLREHGALVAAAAKAGHVIGNHTDHHFRTMNFFPPEKSGKKSWRVRARWKNGPDTNRASTASPPDSGIPGSSAF